MSAIPGPNATLFGLGAGEGKGSGANWDCLRGDGVGLTRPGGVGALRSRSWIEVGGVGSRSRVTPAGPWVEGKVLGCAGLGVEVEKLIVLSVWDPALQ